MSIELIEVPRCPACGGQDHGIRYTIKPRDLFYGYVYTRTHLGVDPPSEYYIRSCSACGHWFVSPRLPLDAIIGCYPPERFERGVGYYSFRSIFAGQTQTPRVRNADDAWRETWLNRVKRLEQLEVPERAVLDLGCADGAWLRTIEESWRRVGIDNSPGAIDLARKSSPTSIEYVCAEAENYDWGGQRFGVITAFDVMEHVISPSDVVKIVSKLLLPGGLFWFETPCTQSPGARAFGQDWAMLVPAVHLNYYSRESIRRVLEPHGLEIAEEYVGKLNARYARKIAKSRQRRRMFLHMMLRMGPISLAAHAVMRALGYVDDRQTFLKKVANINAAESLRPTLDDNISIIARKIG